MHPDPAGLDPAFPSPEREPMPPPADAADRHAFEHGLLVAQTRLRIGRGYVPIRDLALASFYNHHNMAPFQQGVLAFGVKQVIIDLPTNTIVGLVYDTDLK